MKKIYLSVAVLAMFMASCRQEVKVENDGETKTDSTALDTSNTANAEAEKPRDSVAEMKAWQDYATPGEPHKMMAAEVGSWTNDMTMWHSPDAPPQKATSTAEIKMLMGGKYQETNYKGNMMGMPFEGKATLAYDNATKEYISTWIDNMGTGMMVAKGKMAEGSNSLELRGEMVDPYNGKPMQIREVYTIVDADTRKMEMYDTKGGKEYKMMEIVMKRKK
jgi:hypothetical protein